MAVLCRRHDQLRTACGRRAARRKEVQEKEANVRGRASMGDGRVVPAGNDSLEGSGDHAEIVRLHPNDVAASQTCGCQPAGVRLTEKWTGVY